MAKCKCKRCGAIMNIPRAWADLCYDCSNEELNNIQRKWNEENGVDLNDIMIDVKKVLKLR